MQLIARTNSGATLPAAEQVELGASIESRYHVTPGQEYGVFAMSLLAPFLDLDSFSLHMLVMADTGKPSWSPIGLFEVVDRKLSADWLFKTVPPMTNWRVRALWGYSSMVANPAHHDALTLGEIPALRVFLKEIDRSCAAGNDEENLSRLAGYVGKEF